MHLLFMEISNTLLASCKSDARCFLCSPATKMVFDSARNCAVGDCLTTRTLADICDLTAHNSIDGLW